MRPATERRRGAASVLHRGRANWARISVAVLIGGTAVAVTMVALAARPTPAGQT
ncbi:hypothetical protein [Streptomyces sp. NPDC001604]|uniref:hypothetical protein n=1 Tax=Streptomyces sp. NPDC001604 TaxID=3364593 RepID=UPI0036931EFC